MKGTIIRTTNEFLKLKESWDELQRENPDLTYNDTFEYNYNWWKSFDEKRGGELFLFTVYNTKGKVVAIFPFAIKVSRHYGLKIRTLEFISKGDQHNYLSTNDIGNKSKIFNLLFSCLEEHKDEFDKVKLSHLNLCSHFSKFLLKHQKYNKYFTLLVESPVLIKKNHHSIKEYKQEYLSKNVKNLNNRLIKDVGYTFEVKRDDCLDEISIVHKNQQSQETRDKRRSLFEDDKYMLFLRKLYSQKTHYTFLLKNKSGACIAYQTAYFHNGRLLFWNMGYDLQYSQYSLGRIGIYKMIEYFFENPELEILDFGSGRYPWKFQWTSDISSIYILEYYSKNSKKIQLIERIKKLKNGLRCLSNSLKKQRI
ncbi:hypothetical protein VIBNISOn1_480052 [Vibrio nigripulchritudo SOn1]|uniref:BioF2-like acetyltransferase domain-containing protein n=1 Tax=Vibrio nigripulchritudo SOn1 TaxID=1238450 RepID=A0AAV2VUV2_9VIBR|nr:GNAT family N-acetyltransferase [Vibrio nigripulchritudo]CCO48253.1 hypothetical protein VIBNISOn1_480052 [Vibrio nigripulchritudo SOn1]